MKRMKVVDTEVEDEKGAHQFLVAAAAAAAAALEALEAVVVQAVVGIISIGGNIRHIRKREVNQNMTRRKKIKRTGKKIEAVNETGRKRRVAMKKKGNEKEERKNLPVVRAMIRM